MAIDCTTCCGGNPAWNAGFRHAERIARTSQRQRATQCLIEGQPRGVE